MKKTLISVLAILMIVSTSTAQTLGWNGVGFFKYATEQDKADLIEASGFNTEFRFRIDKDVVVNTGKMISLVKLYEASGKKLQVVVTAKSNSADFNFRVIDSLFKAGITPYIELGNERYASQFKHTFASYIGEYQSTVTKVKAVYPNAVFIVNVMPRPEGSFIAGPKKGSGEWNAAAYSYCVENSARISWHSYINKKDNPDLASAPTNVVYNPATPDSRLPVYYDKLANHHSELPSQTIAYLRVNFPGIKVHFTEIGIVPEEDESLDSDEQGSGTSLIRNTVAYSNLLYQMLHEYSAYENTESVDIHAGVTLNGIIAPASKYDVSTSSVKKIEFYAFELFNETGPLELLPETLSLQEGMYVYRIAYGQQAPSVTVSRGYAVTTNCRYVAGNSWTTSGGSGFMSKGTGKIPVFPGVSFSDAVPVNGFGYIEYSVEKIVIPGCTDPKAENYNSEATDDDGTCTYPPPPPTECLKKRWLFPSLGCKPSKKVCDC